MKTSHHCPKTNKSDFRTANNVIVHIVVVVFCFCDITNIFNRLFPCPVGGIDPLLM